MLVKRGNICKIIETTSEHELKVRFFRLFKENEDESWNNLNVNDTSYGVDLGIYPDFSALFSIPAKPIVIKSNITNVEEKDDYIDVIGTIKSVDNKIKLDDLEDDQIVPRIIVNELEDGKYRFSMMLGVDIRTKRIKNERI